MYKFVVDSRDYISYISFIDGKLWYCYNQASLSGRNYIYSDYLKNNIDFTELRFK